MQIVLSAEAEFCNWASLSLQARKNAGRDFDIGKMFRKWFLSYSSSPGQSSVMMLCAVKIDGAKRLLFQLFLSDRRESVDRDEREHVCVQPATSMENCGLGHIIASLL